MKRSDFLIRVVSGETTGSQVSSGSAPATNPFSEELGKLVNAVGLTQVEYAGLLSARLGRQVSQVVLSNWLRGRRPRKTRRGDPEAEVLAAARDILANQGKAPTRIDAAEVRAVIAGWLERGLTFSQIQISGEVPESVLRDWEKGRSSVLRPRWEAFCQRVSHYVDLVVESQVAWRVEAVVRQRIARAKKLVGKNGITTLEEAYERLRAAELIAEESGPKSVIR